MIAVFDHLLRCTAMSRPIQNPFAVFAFDKQPNNTGATAMAATTPEAFQAEQVDRDVPSHSRQSPEKAAAAPTYTVAAQRRSRKQIKTLPGQQPSLAAAGADASIAECDNSSCISRLTAAESSKYASGRGSIPKGQRKAYAALTGAPKGLPEKLGCAPLRLILIGHNPSEHAWHTGHYYSNPSNRMWRTLIATGIAPPGATGCEADDSMPSDVGVGFTDVGSGHPGTDSSQFKPKDFQQWRGSFYRRLTAHMQEASASIGCTCGRCGAPALVAFTGKRHYMELLNLDHSGQQLRGKAKKASTSVQLGPQPSHQLPAGWPLPADKTEVWVLTSTSGAAPMSNDDRERPYMQLAQRLQEIPWPREVQNSCTMYAETGEQLTGAPVQ